MIGKVKVREPCFVPGVEHQTRITVACKLREYPGQDRWATGGYLSYNSVKLLDRATNGKLAANFVSIRLVAPFCRLDFVCPYVYAYPNMPVLMLNSIGPNIVVYHCQEGFHFTRIEAAGTQAFPLFFP